MLSALQPRLKCEIFARTDLCFTAFSTRPVCSSASDDAFIQHTVTLSIPGSSSVSVGVVGVPFGVENGARAQKLGKLDFQVTHAFASALSDASLKLGAATPVMISVVEAGETNSEAVPVSVSLPLCALLDNKFKFRIRLHASMPGSGIADNVDIDLPAKYTGCGADSLEEGWHVSVESVLAAAAPSGEGTAFLAYVPARQGADEEELPTKGAPYNGQRRIATSSDGKAAIDPATGTAQTETPPPTFWQKYGTYIMIGGAVFLFAGGGGGGGEGGEGGQRRAAGGNARG